MIRIGILGNIGSGKTYVANNLGFPVFNADYEVSVLYKKNKKIFLKLNKILPKTIKSFPIEKKEITEAILQKKGNLKKIMAHYFGYGSNMSRSFIENVRGISPKKSVLGCLENYSLIMNLKGPNFVEPSFANIRYEKGKIVEGILHEISDL